MTTASNIHSTRSSHREALLEHLFAGEVMKHLWLRGDWFLEVLKPQVDDSGYDLVLEANGITRHVQLKASFHGSKLRSVPINRLLANKPSGCVVCMRFDRSTLALGPFLFFGAGPGKPLPSVESMRSGRHTKGNAQGVKAERPSIKMVPLSKFRQFETVAQLVEGLFGPVRGER